MGGWPVEAGAEFVHGTRSAFTRLCAEFAAEDASAAAAARGGRGGAARDAAAPTPLSFVEKPWPDRWWFGRQSLLTNEEPPEIERLHEIMDAVGDEPPPPAGRDVAADSWLREKKGATEAMLRAAEACYANDFGARLSELGLREMIAENNAWDSGETYLVMEQPMSEVAARLARGLEVWLGWPVARIDSGGRSGGSGGGNGGGNGGGGGNGNTNGVVLERAAAASSSSSSSSLTTTTATTTPSSVHSSRPRTIRAARVVVTVPLGVLKAGVIAFSPPLPRRKRLAVSRLRFGNAIKIVLSFTRPFWPDDLYDVVCTDELVPEFWMTRRPVTDPAHAHLSPVTGFCAGSAADAVSAMGPDAAVLAFISQLDRVFGTLQDPRPATATFAKASVFDWARHEHALGAYSFPSLGAEDGDREALAAPLACGAVFFAGEATHAAVNPCMQAALETGDRAAAQVRASMPGGRPASRL
jgi:monoamine oxidase